MNINNISSITNGVNLVPAKEQPQVAGSEPHAGRLDENGAFQLQLNHVVKAVLAEMAKNIGKFDAVLQSLPDEFKEEFLSIVKENMPGINEVAQGLTSMMQSQKQTADKLMTMSEMLDTLVLYQQEDKSISELPGKINNYGAENLLQANLLTESDINQLSESLLFGKNAQGEEKLFTAKQPLQQFFSNTDSQVNENSLFGKKGLEVSAQKKSFTTADIIRLSEQLLSESPEGNEQSLIANKQLLQQFLSEKDIQVLAKEILNYSKLFKSLEQQIPQNVQRAVVQYHLPELADAYMLLNLREMLFQKDNPLANKLVKMLNSSLFTQGGFKNVSILSCLNEVENFTELENNFPALKNWTASDIVLLASKLSSSLSETEEQQSLGQVKQLLQQFFSSKSGEVPVKELANFHKLFSRVGQQIPKEVQQAALQYQLPKLTDAYVLLKLHDIMQWKDMSADVLRECSEKLQDLSNSVQKSIAANGGEKTSTQTIAAFTMPIIFEGTSQPYPLYIHIFSDGEQENKNLISKGREVWMRLSLTTENIGTVNVLLHFYGERQLNVKVDFSSSEYVKSFLDYVPDIKANIDDLKIKLADINVRSVNNSNGGMYD